MTTDNSTASGIANDIIKQKRSKAIDMRFWYVSINEFQIVSQRRMCWMKNEQ